LDIAGDPPPYMSIRAVGGFPEQSLGHPVDLTCQLFMGIAELS
jgi:hypothetical protein